jgi:hypothetical protein
MNMWTVASANKNELIITGTEHSELKSTKFANYNGLDIHQNSQDPTPDFSGI